MSTVGRLGLLLQSASVYRHEYRSFPMAQRYLMTTVSVCGRLHLLVYT